MSEVREKDGQEKEEKEEEEYVLLELDDCLYSDIPPGASYVLSGLDTLTPTLVLGDSLKMIVYAIWSAIHSENFCNYTLSFKVLRGQDGNKTGEYEETVGTCYLFSESAAPPKPIHDKTPLSGECEDEQAKSHQEAASKEVKHLASVNKILKFRSIHVDQQQHRGYQHNDREI